MRAKPALGELKDIVEKSLDKEKGELVMTLAEQLRREGRIEGKREGKLEGRLEGERSMILESIELSVSLRFGKTSLENFMAHVKKIQEMDTLKEIFRKIQLARNEEEIKALLL